VSSRVSGVAAVPGVVVTEDLYLWYVTAVNKSGRKEVEGTGTFQEAYGILLNAVDETQVLCNADVNSLRELQALRQEIFKLPVSRKVPWTNRADIKMDGFPSIIRLRLEKVPAPASKPAPPATLPRTPSPAPVPVPLPRAGTADREKYGALLARAFQHGFITYDEFQERTDRCFATIYKKDLPALVEDIQELPPEPPEPPASPAHRKPPGRRLTLIPVAALGLIGASMPLIGILSPQSVPVNAIAIVILLLAIAAACVSAEVYRRWK
jgi:hypothetical protein